MTTRIILARHGESTVNVVHLASDDYENNPLTELGVRQAQQLARDVADDTLVHVYTSPMQRARETGQAVAVAYGLPISVEHGLEEIRVGVHAGERGAVSLNRGTLDFKRWLADGDLSHGYSGGETGFEVVDRASAALRAIVSRHPDEAVLVVSHGGAIAMTVPALCHNLRPEVLYTRQLGNCATVIVEVDADNDDWTCVAWIGDSPDGFATESVA